MDYIYLAVVHVQLLVPCLMIQTRLVSLQERGIQVPQRLKKASSHFVTEVRYI